MGVDFPCFSKNICKNPFCEVIIGFLQQSFSVIKNHFYVFLWRKNFGNRHSCFFFWSLFKNWASKTFFAVFHYSLRNGKNLRKNYSLSSHSQHVCHLINHVFYLIDSNRHSEHPKITRSNKKPGKKIQESNKRKSW